MLRPWGRSSIPRWIVVDKSRPATSDSFHLPRRALIVGALERKSEKQSRRVLVVQNALTTPSGVTHVRQDRAPSCAQANAGCGGRAGLPSRGGLLLISRDQRRQIRSTCHAGRQLWGV